MASTKLINVTVRLHGETMKMKVENGPTVADIQGRVGAQNTNATLMGRLVEADVTLKEGAKLTLVQSGDKNAA
jgi:hypothetical protein